MRRFNIKQRDEISQCCLQRAHLQVGAVFGHASVAATTVIREDNNTEQNPPLLEGFYLVMHTSLCFASPLPPTKELFTSHFPHMYEYIVHLRQVCYNSKSMIFQEKLLNDLKCYNFLWVQRRLIYSPAASFANCVMTLYLLKVHLQTFLSIPVTQKCQNLSCDTLVANERYAVWRHTYVHRAGPTTRQQSDDMLLTFILGKWDNHDRPTFLPTQKNIKRKQTNAFSLDWKQELDDHKYSKPLNPNRN
jgi:hypothetical protein